MSSTSATATQVTYVVRFRSTHSLTQNTSTLTLSAPAGTVFPAQGSYTIADPRTGQSRGCLSATVSAGSNSVVVTTGIDVGAGDPVAVIVDGVGNSPGTGAPVLAVSTSSNTAPVGMPSASRP